MKYVRGWTQLHRQSSLFEIYIMNIRLRRLSAESLKQTLHNIRYKRRSEKSTQVTPPA